MSTGAVEDGGPRGGAARSRPEAPSLHRKLVWLTFFRVVMVTVLLGGAAAMAWTAREAWVVEAAAPLFALVAATYGASLLFALALRVRFAEKAVAHAQIVTDVAVALAVVRLTGGAESVFVFLFSLATVNGSILLFRRGAVVSTALAVATYVLGVVLLAPGATPRADTVFGHVAAFALTAALAGYLAEQLRDTGERLAAREDDLEAVTAIHEALVQSVSSGLLTVDPEGRITFLNRAGEQLTGLALRDVQGGPVERWFGAFQEVTAREEMSLRKEMEFVDGRGERRRVGYAAFPLRGRAGAVMGHALIFQDLTAMRAMEDAVRRSERLADLGRLAAGLAHELRNPLASISGSIELLMAGERLRDADRRLMEIVLREAGRLEDLVRRFLQFTRPPAPRCTPTDVAAVVSETLDVFAQDPAGERLAVERELAPAVVACDGDQVRQVLWNLLTNAAQAIVATKEQPPPADPLARARGLIRVSCAPERDGGARLVVADDGPGIAAPDLLRVFTPFFTTKRDGTGLGLATVHRIVEAHGGSVSVDSREGEGATFVVRLPPAPPAGGPAGPG